jgi:putative glutamine amidotransferase
MQKTDQEAVSSYPVIGILSSIMLKETSPFLGIERSFVNHDYVSAVEAAHGIPLLMPVVEDEATTRRQIESVDALLFTGGYDPNPLLYGENPTRRIEFIFPEIDAHQMAAVRIAAEMGKPMLGICRGLQILNIAFGGTLYQDLTLAPNSYVQHSQKSRKHSPGHQVTIVKDSMLSEIFAESTIVTNSFHHLAVKDLAPGFAASAYAVDGIIEGIERRGDVPVFAVQWHPEMMYEKHPAMLGVFTKFMGIAKGARKR